MMSGKAAPYFKDVGHASSRAGSIALGVAVGWLVWPVAVATCIHPEDVSGGEGEAIAILAALACWQLILTALFYRAAKMEGAAVAATPILWPISLIVVTLGNAAWLYATGWDTEGCLIGLSSVSMTIGAEWICNKLGKEFVCGDRNPSYALVAEQAEEAADGEVFYYVPE